MSLGTFLYEIVTEPDERDQDRRRKYRVATNKTVSAYLGIILLLSVPIPIFDWFDMGFVSLSLLFTGSILLAVDSLLEMPEFDGFDGPSNLYFTLTGFLLLASGTTFGMAGQLEPGSLLFAPEKQLLVAILGESGFKLIVSFTHWFAAVSAPILVTLLVIGTVKSSEEEK